jgi:hypothetical protein
MRNIREREREKRMMGHGRDYFEDFLEPEKEKREQERREQELIRDTNAPLALRVFYIVVASVLLLLLIVGILGANVFHFW